MNNQGRSGFRSGFSTDQLSGHGWQRGDHRHELRLIRLCRRRSIAAASVIKLTRPSFGLLGLVWVSGDADASASPLLFAESNFDLSRIPRLEWGEHAARVRFSAARRKPCSPNFFPRQSVRAKMVGRSVWRAAQHRRPAAGTPQLRRSGLILCLLRLFAASQSRLQHF